MGRGCLTGGPTPCTAAAGRALWLQPSTAVCACGSSPVQRATPRDEGASLGAVGAAPEAIPGGAAVGEDAGAGPSGSEMAPKPKGGHRPGTGRLGAEA